MIQYARSLALYSASELAMARLDPVSSAAKMQALAAQNQAIYRISAVQSAYAEQSVFGTGKWTVQWGAMQFQRALKASERAQPVMPDFETLDQAIEAFLDKVRR
tara:strand:+ start:370 stop:681 length:312 start_codon:yes stop_codon:yes gene_type:complete